MELFVGSETVAYFLFANGGKKSVEEIGAITEWHKNWK
jgi:hypothetical protein